MLFLAPVVGDDAVGRVTPAEFCSHRRDPAGGREFRRLRGRHRPAEGGGRRRVVLYL